MSNARQLAANLPREGGLSNRNLIINGAMQVAQRGTSFSNVFLIGYGLDRMRHGIILAGTHTISQSTDAPEGFSNSWKMECTTASASLLAGGVFTIGQVIEGQNLQHLSYGTANAKTLTLSFWVKGSKTGTHITELYNSNSTRSISATYTINSANTWEYKTITFSGDTTGTFNNDNGASLYVNLWLAASSTYSSGTLNTSWASSNNPDRAVGSPNYADTVGNTFQFTGLQLEVGDSSTPFEHRSYSDQLQACQRYFQRITGAHKSGGSVGDRGVFMGHCWSTNSMYWVHHFTTPMRSGPSVSQSNSGSSLGTWYSGGSTAAPLSALNIQSGNEMRAEMYCTLSSTLPAGNGSWFRLGGDSYWVDFDAEL